MNATTTEKPTANGGAPDAEQTAPAAPEIVFPLESFREAATHLRRPFTVAAVKFKVQATWPKDKPTGGLVVAYIDARLAVERLNLLVPHLWFDAYEPLGQKHLICKLTVDGITRQDVGEGQGKGLYSDALKRASVKFGVGVSLYAIPKMRIDVSRGEAKRTREGLSLELTPNGESRVRLIYSNWLDAQGIQAFGAPLDHGDVEDAQGDAETDVPDAAAAPEAAQDAAPVATVTAEDIVALQSAASGLKGAQVKLALSAVGIDPPQPFTSENAFDSVPIEKAAALAKKLAEISR